MSIFAHVYAKYVQKNNITDCTEWTGALTNGYGAITAGGSSWPAHRLAWTMDRGIIPQGLDVCHHCDNRMCVNTFHMFLGTAIDNAADALAKGRLSTGPRRSSYEVFQPGEKHKDAKLTEADVRAIRASTDTLTTLMDRYKMSRPAIWKAKYHKSWRHLK